MSLSVGLPMLLASVFLQAGLLPELFVRGGRPDLVLLVVVSWSILGRDLEGIAWAFVGGMLLDLFSGAPFGVSSLGLVAVAYVAGLGRGRVGRRNVVLPLLMAALGTTLFHAVTLAMLVLLGLQSPTWLASLQYVTLPSGLLNLALVLPIFFLLGFVHSWLHPQRKKMSS